MTQPLRLSPDSLLAHEPFVRAVVRDLLRDEHRVQDVLQETWMRALRRGPREEGSLKGWLARVARRLALDQHRGSARRDRRERETARGEALESVEALHARLEAQREVVDAVLALEEPYKSVVLLRYYEDLAAEEIGERLSRSASTVRSQLSRAHEFLRRRLDARHGGARSAWAGALAPWALATKSHVGVLAAAGIGVLLVGAGAWMLPRLRTDRVAEILPLATDLPAHETDLRSELSTVAESPAREPVPVALEARSAMAQTKPDLSRLDADALRDLAVQAMRTLEKRLLTPDAQFVEEQHALLALPDTGVTRLIMRTRDGYPYDGLILPRCGGSFFSFATLSHDYNCEPDIGYEAGRVRAGFAGADVGMVLDVGDLDLARFAPRSSGLPATNPEIRRDAWEYLFAAPETDDIPGARTMQARVRELRITDAAVKAGRTYLVRVWNPEEHDHLVGMRVLALDGEGMTIAWRVLERFPHAAPRREGFQTPTWDSVPASPDWIERLEKQQLVALIHEIRKHAEPLLLGIPEPLRAASAWRTEGAATSGFFRLLSRDRYVPAVEAPWGATSYSIEKQKHTDRNAQVARNGERLDAEFLFDLAKLESAEFQGVASGRCPARLTGKSTEAWNFLWNTPSVYTRNGGTSDRAISDEDRLRFRELTDGWNRAIAGHSYLLRAIDPNEDTDRLVLLTVLETTDSGTTLCWRELKRFDR